VCSDSTASDGARFVFWIPNLSFSLPFLTDYTIKRGRHVLRFSFPVHSVTHAARMCVGDMSLNASKCPITPVLLALDCGAVFTWSHQGAVRSHRIAKLLVLFSNCEFEQVN